MTGDIYEFLALAMRYVFIALMLLVTLRAWRITLKDSHRANQLRAWSPETGIAGELVVLDGGQKAPEGMRYPVIREGMLGSSAKADIRVRHASVRKRHCYFTLEEGGLRVRRADRFSVIRYDRKRLIDAVLPDGAVFSVGRIRLLLVLNESSRAAGPSREAREEVLRQERDDTLFDVPLDAPPKERPARPDADARDIPRTREDPRRQERDAQDIPRTGEKPRRPDTAPRGDRKTGEDMRRTRREAPQAQNTDDLFMTDGEKD